MRGTLTEQDLSEVSEQEYHDSPATRSSDSPSVSKNRTVTCLTVTLHCFIIHMKEYQGVFLGLDERLKFGYMKIPVGKHAVEMCLRKKCAFRRCVLLTPLLQICQLMKENNSFFYTGMDN